MQGCVEVQAQMGVRVAETPPSGRFASGSLLMVRCVVRRGGRRGSRRRGGRCWTTRRECTVRIPANRRGWHPAREGVGRRWRRPPALARSRFPSAAKTAAIGLAFDACGRSLGLRLGRRCRGHDSHARSAWFARFHPHSRSATSALARTTPPPKAPARPRCRLRLRRGQRRPKQLPQGSRVCKRKRASPRIEGFEAATNLPLRATLHSPPMVVPTSRCPVLMAISRPSATKRALRRAGRARRPPSEGSCQIEAWPVIEGWREGVSPSLRAARRVHGDACKPSWPFWCEGETPSPPVAMLRC